MSSVNTLFRLLCVTGVGLLVPFPGHTTPHTGVGGISLNQTRVVFNADDKAQTLTVKNTSDRTFLIQSRVTAEPDGGDAVPFIITPPLFTIAPDSSQVLRILPQGKSFPTDRESLYYVSVIAIPAGQSQEAESLQMSVGLRFGLKLFYRPSGLDAPAKTTGCRLRFSRSAQGVRIENPTSYFQTLGHLTLGNVPVSLESRPAMLPPGGAQTWSVSTMPGDVKWQVINDYGALSTQCLHVFTDNTEAR